MVYVCSAGAHSINRLSKGTYIHCRKRTAIHSKTVNMAEQERKNMPALKYGISGEIQHLLVVDQWYKGIIKDTEYIETNIYALQKHNSHPP